jgi:hypothetical protein
MMGCMHNDVHGEHRVRVNVYGGLAGGRGVYCGLMRSNAAKSSTVERWFSVNADCFVKHIFTRFSRRL